MSVKSRVSGNQLLLLPNLALLKKSILAHVAQGKKWVLSLG